MRVAVITAAHLPYPNPYLDKCIQSVKDQTHTDIHHIIVNDGAPPYFIPGVEVINLPTCHNNFGDTPRAIGAASAIGREFDAIAWLDYDNWYEPNHIQSLIDCLKIGEASIATSARTLYTMEGVKLGPCYEVDGINFVDGNCYLVSKESFRLTWMWLNINPKDHCVDDRIIWDEVKRMIKDEGTVVVFSALSTVCYRTNYAEHYKHFGLAVTEMNKTTWTPNSPAK